MVKDVGLCTERKKREKMDFKSSQELQRLLERKKSSISLYVSLFTRRKNRSGVKRSDFLPLRNGGQSQVVCCRSTTFLN